MRFFALLVDLLVVVAELEITVIDTPRDLPWDLDLSTTNCLTDSLPGFSLTGGTFTEYNKLSCSCACDGAGGNSCQVESEEMCSVNFSFSFNIPIRQVQFYCYGCQEVEVTSAAGQKHVNLHSMYANLQYSHYVLIEGNGLLNISAIGYEPIDLQYLEYRLAYQACDGNKTDSFGLEECEHLVQQDLCNSNITTSNHTMSVRDLCPVSCGICHGVESRTWTRTTTTATNSTTTTTPTTTSMTTTTTSTTNTNTTSTTSTTSSTSSFSSTSTSASTSTKSTSTSTRSTSTSTGTRVTSTHTMTSSTATTSISTSTLSSTKTTTLSTTDSRSKTAVDEMISGILSEMLSSDETKVSRESESAIITAETLVWPLPDALVPESASDTIEYLSVAVEGSSDVSASIPSSLIEEVGTPVTVVVAALKDDVTVGPDVSMSLGVENGGGMAMAGRVQMSLYGLNGAPIVVQDLETPVLITLSRASLETPVVGSTWVCVFWNATEQRWSTEGVERVVNNGDIDSEGDKGLICATRHLTIFSAILQQLQCLNIQVFSAGGLEKASKEAWPISAAAILFWILVGCWLLLFSLACRGSTLSSDMQWKDENFVLNVPSAQRKPACLQLCQDFRRKLRRVCKQLYVLHRMDWEEGLMLYLGFLGMHCVLATKSGISVTMLRRHLINKEGWTIHHDMASSSSPEVKKVMQNLSVQVPEAFLSFAQMDSWTRCKLFLRSLHPYSSSILFSLEQSPAIRMKLKADVMFGALAVSAFFFAVTDSATSTSSPAECAESRMSPWRFVLMGFFSASFVSIPVSLVSLFWQRSFVDSNGVMVQRQLRLWLLQDVCLWTCSWCYTIFCSLYVSLFIANLNGQDHWKWILTFLTIILRLAVLQPIFIALLLTFGTAWMQRRRPMFFSEGHPRLHFQVRTPKMAQEKVKDLASRSMSVADLLSFWQRIPESMGHFHPEVATTSDVVCQAVIPLSKARVNPESESTSYATMLAGGCYRPPDVMVTHNWSNKYLHLVAAIFAEAMGHRTYETTSRLLAQQRMAILQEELGTSLLRRYWICCFCVNQHASICDKTPAMDSTGVVIAKCNCGVAKHIAGDHCEMDKFDAMIGYLAAVVPTFCQVVAVDLTFTLFERVWCIAELAEAKQLRLQQFPIVHSEGSLEKSIDAVKSLDVRECKASVPEDKERVLEKIPDFERFNQSMQDLLLNQKVGLLTQLSLELCGSSVGIHEALDAATHLVVEALPLPGGLAA